jgi:hypothetical protein
MEKAMQENRNGRPLRNTSAAKSSVSEPSEAASPIVVIDRLTPISTGPRVSTVQ